MHPTEGQFTFHVKQKDGGWEGSHTLSAMNKEQALSKASAAYGDKYDIKGLMLGKGDLRLNVKDNYKYTDTSKFPGE